MAVHELPMILFTVIAQLCVGMFVVLGVIDLGLSRRRDRTVVRRLTEPLVYAIGPVLVVGLVVSMFHMNDVLHVLNVLRHPATSWLSREIYFGVGFAAAGFLFAVLQWFRLGSETLRRVIAGVAAVIGLGLVWSMSMIYFTVRSVPAWHTWFVPVSFFATTVLLGCLATAAALMITHLVRSRSDRARQDAHGATSSSAGPSPEGMGSPIWDTEAADSNPSEPSQGGVALMTRVRTQVVTKTRVINAATTESEWSLLTTLVQRTTFVAALVGVAVLVAYPLHVAALASAGGAGQSAAAVFSGVFFIVRISLLAAATLLIAITSFQLAGTSTKEHPTMLTVLVTGAFAMALAAELMGRSLHYVSMIPVGI